MKNTKKRLLALLLCTVLCVSLLPIPVLAEEGTVEAAEQEGTVVAAAAEYTSEQNTAFAEEGPASPDAAAAEEDRQELVPAVNETDTESENDEEDIAPEESRGTKADDYLIGMCGNSMFWTLYNDGSFTISGNLTGPMNDYSASERPDWYEHRARIWTARFGTVTNVGHFAMTGCYNMTSVTMEKVVDIGNSSFAACTSLPSIVIPETVKTIGNNAFAGCEELKEIVFEGDAPTFGEEVFKEVVATAIYPANASGWTASVRQDYEGEITWVNGHCGNNAYWTILNNVLVISGTGVMEDYMRESSYYSEDSSTAPWYEFRDRFDTIVIQSGITKIGDYAFYGCTSVTTMTIPDSVTGIGDSAFYGCTALTSVTIPDSVAEIGYRAFGNCSTLTQATIGNGVTSIGGAAFEYCSSLAEIVIPDSVTEIGYGAFRSCSMLTTATIGNSVTIIGGAAFYSCSSLAEIVIPDSVTEIGYEAFRDCSMLTTATIGNGVTIIGASAFEFCDSLLVVVIPGSASIGTSAFENCRSLASVSLGNSVTDIGNCAFEYCESLTSIEIPGSVISIGNSAFYNCDQLTEVVIRDGVTSIGNSAFSYCRALTGIVIPDSVTSLSPYAFNYCSAMKSAVIGNGITIIPSNAFSGCTSLESVTMENGVTSIDQQAFYSCRSLVSITLGDHLESTGYQSFCGCSSLTEIKLPESMVSLGDGTFWNCSSLTDVELPSSLLSIGEQAFYFCSSLEEITIPDTVASIGDNAFSGCDTLASIIVPAGVTNIGGLAFYMCESLEEIIVDEENENYASLDGVLFNKDFTLLICYPAGKQDTAYAIPAGVLAIEEYAFDRCYALRSVNISDSVTTIGNGTFWDCEGLTDVVFGNSVQTIGQKAFEYCESLVSITISDSVKQIDKQAFNSCSSLISVVIGNGVTNIGYSAFGNCENLQDLMIGNSVKIVDYYAFSNCTALTNITLPNTVTYIGNGVFSGCSSLVSVNIPYKVSSIGIKAFSGCTALESVTIPASLTTLGKTAFENCTSLTTVTFEGDAPTQDGLSYMQPVFEGVTATAYYPADNETWTEEVRQSFGGTITWITHDVPKLEVTFRHNCEFGANIAMHYLVPKSAVEGFENIALEIDMEKYAEGSTRPTTESCMITRWTDYTLSGEEYCHFVFPGIFAAEMGNKITARVSGTKDGITVLSKADEYSVKDYAYNRMASTDKPTYRTLLVDMLNYGSAAQTHFKKNDRNLVNWDLTEEQASWGTQGDLVTTNNESVVELEGATAEINGKNLMFGSSVYLLYRMAFAEGQDMSNVKIVFTYTNLKGEVQQQTVKASKFGTSGDYYTADCTNIIPSAMRQIVSATIYDGDTPISSTLNYSIETYVHNRLANSTSATFKTLITEMLRYGISAENHFG